jgi:hypothetical protein
MVSILKKSNLTISQYGDASLPLASITGDQYGFVTVEAGSGESAQFQVFDPNGNYGEDGGGAEFMLNTIQGTPPSTAP